MKEDMKFQLVAKYLKAYVLELTKEEKETFLAITDISSDLLPDEYIPSVEGCTLIRIEPEDYSSAVRYRNDGSVKKLVLLYRDSVRRIDSLKDFIECPIIPEEKSVLWKLLCDVFDINYTDDKAEEYVSTLVQSVPIEIGDFLRYMYDCISTEKGEKIFSRKKLNDKVCRFGVWRTKGNFPNKTMLQRHLRYSRPDFIRSRLEKALDDEALDETTRKEIVAALKNEELETLIKNVDLSKVDRYFRYKRSDNKNKKREEDEEHSYAYSYEKLLKEEEQNIFCVEEDIRVKDEDSEEEKKDETDPFIDACRTFLLKEDELQESRGEILSLITIVDEYAIPDEKKAKWKEYLYDFLYEFDRALDRGDYRVVTPVKLCAYCEKQKKFISIYFKMMSWILEDEAMNHLCDGTDLIEKLQTLFCRGDKNGIDMPYYHPIAGLYFLRLKELYEMAWEEEKGMGQLSEIPYYIVEQEKNWYPIRFLQKEHILYQLDYTSLRLPARIKFYEKGNGGTNSPVNFRLLNSVIEEYIIKNPFLGELYISIVDMDDVRGLPFLINRLQRLVNGDACLLSRITINIVSLKERELKRELSRLYDMGMGNPGIYFRFTRGKYTKDGRELDFEGLLENCDLIFFADTDVMYNSGKLIRYTEEPNAVRRRLEEFDLDEQVSYLLKGKNYIELLWDTLQRIQNGGEAILSRWSNQELNLRKLKELGKKIQIDPHFEAVIISANERLLRHIYQEEYYRISKNRVSGNESILLSLSQQNRKRKLSTGLKSTAEISLSRLLDELSGEEDFCRQLLENENMQEILLRAIYEEGKIHFQCVIVTNDEESAEEEKERYQNFAEELIGYAFAGKGYLGERFREMLINELYGRTEEYSMTMALYQFDKYKCELPEVLAIVQNSVNQENPIYRSTDVMELLDMLDFFHELKVVDESSITRFREYYKKEMLLSTLTVAERDKLLEERIWKNMKDIYERIRD